MAVRRLGVIGDVHAEHERLEAAIIHLNTLDVDCLVCTGDIVDGIGNPDRSVKLLQDSGVKTVRGNHDRWVVEEKARHIPDAHQLSELKEETRQYLVALPRQISLETIAGKLLLCHGVAEDDLRKVWPGTQRMSIERSTALDEIITNGEFRYLINGHMHFRTIIHFEKLTLINAGTLKGEHWPGFSLIDFEQHEITAFEFATNGIQAIKTQKLVDDHHVIWSNTQSFTGDWEPVRLF